MGTSHGHTGWVIGGKKGRGSWVSTLIVLPQRDCQISSMCLWVWAGTGGLSWLHLVCWYAQGPCSPPSINAWRNVNNGTHRRSLPQREFQQFPLLVTCFCSENHLLKIQFPFKPLLFLLLSFFFVLFFLFVLQDQRICTPVPQ